MDTPDTEVLSAICAMHDCDLSGITLEEIIEQVKTNEAPSSPEPVFEYERIGDRMMVYFQHPDIAKYIVISVFNDEDDVLMKKFRCIYEKSLESIEYEGNKNDLIDSVVNDIIGSLNILRYYNPYIRIGVKFTDNSVVPVITLQGNIDIADWNTIKRAVKYLDASYLE